MKNIAVFIDGTRNSGSADALDNTNVYKLWRCMDSSAKTMYIRGVGTRYREPGLGLWWLQGKVSKAIDLVFGRGATKRIKRAYLFLAQTYEDGDRVFLFGFSRGAFIARMLAGFVNKVGLLFQAHAQQPYVEYAFYLYTIDVEGHLLFDFLRDMRQCGLLPQESRGIPVHFLGQWDTVAALEHVGRVANSERELLKIAKREQHQPLPDWITHCRHAVAIHDLRKTFEPLLWDGVSDQSRQTLKQAWFAGAHADVGGGYRSDEHPGTMLSDIALEWMLDEARNCKLQAYRPDGMQLYQSGTVPHRSNVRYSRWEPLRVRQQLLEADQRTLFGEYLHESACSRLWEPLMENYREHVTDYADSWNEADMAAMRLHWSHCFADRVPMPWLSPGDLLADFNAFIAAIKGNSPPGEKLVERVMYCVAAFGTLDTWRLIPTFGSVAWDNKIRDAWMAASKQLQQSIAERDVDPTRDKVLMNFYFGLTV